MKTYLFDTFNRYKRFSENLDVMTILCNKSWWGFNDSGEKEIYIFQTDGSLIISYGGKVTHATWQYISVNKSLIISSKEQSYMLHPTFKDNIIFALQLDGTEQYSFMIDENQFIPFQLASFSDLQRYFRRKEEEEQMKIEQEHEKLLQLEREEAIQKEKKHQENIERLARSEKVAINKRYWKQNEQEILRKDTRYQELRKKKIKWQIYLWGSLIICITNIYIFDFYAGPQQPLWVWTINLPCFVICGLIFLIAIIAYFLIKEAPKNYKKWLEKEFINKFNS